MRKIRLTDKFEKEISKFPLHIREDIFRLVKIYLEGGRLPHTLFKTYEIKKGIRIQQFKAKDHSGNWRAISCLEDKKFLTFVYAFHKKSEALLEKDKKTIVKRIKEVLK